MSWRLDRLIKLIYIYIYIKVLKPCPIPMPTEIGIQGSLDRALGVQTHSGPPVFLVPFLKDLSRLNGTSQPNQKWMPVQGIEPVSLDHKYQPLTIEPFLTPKKNAPHNVKNGINLPLDSGLDGRRLRNYFMCLHKFCDNPVIPPRVKFVIFNVCMLQ